MRKVILFIFLSITLIMAGACEQAQVESDMEELGVIKQVESVDDVKKSYKERIIKLGVMHFPPYEYSEDGVVKGPFVDVASYALDRLGYKYTVEEYPWSRLLELSKNGELDGIIDVFDLHERRSFLYYPEEPIGVYNQNLMSLKTSEIEALESSNSFVYTYIGFSKANDLGDLRTEVDQVLKDMKQDGSLYDIFSDYGMDNYASAFKEQEGTDPPPEKYFQNNPNPPLIISLIDDTAPYVYRENGEYTGLIVDIVNEAFSRIGVEFKTEAIPFNRTIIQLEEGTLDIGTDVFIKPEREVFLHYPVDYPLAVYPYTLFKLKSNTFEFKGSPEELQSYKIGYIRGYSLGGYDKYLDDERFTFIESESPEANMKILLNGRVDFVIDVQSTGEAVLEALDIQDAVEVVLPAINLNTSYIAFSKARNLGKLVKEYEEAIKSMQEDGTLQNIYKKYGLTMPRQPGGED